MLARYVREQEALSFEEAVRKMTSLPAQRFGLADRGVLREGAFADLAVFDPDAITDTATFAEPHQYAEGVVHVFVNGQAVLLDGEGSPRLVDFGRARSRPRIQSPQLLQGVCRGQWVGGRGRVAAGGKDAPVGKHGEVVLTAAERHRRGLGVYCRYVSITVDSAAASASEYPASSRSCAMAANARTNTATAL